VTVTTDCLFRLDPKTYLSICHSVFLQVFYFRASINSGWWCVNASTNATRPLLSSLKETRVNIALPCAERKENGDRQRRETREKERENHGVREERVNPPSFINIFCTGVAKLIYGSWSIRNVTLRNVTRLEMRYVLLCQLLGKFCKVCKIVDIIYTENRYNIYIQKSIFIFINNFYR